MLRKNKINKNIILTLFSDLFRCIVGAMEGVGDGGQDEGGESHSLIGSSLIVIIGELVFLLCSCPPDIVG